MNTQAQEFNDQFDLLYNNIISDAAPGLNLYEKSILLTKAQTLCVRDYFSAKRNTGLEGMDDSTTRQQAFLTLEDKFTSQTFTAEDDLTSPNSRLCGFPSSFNSDERYLMVLHELFTIKQGTTSQYREVTPITYGTYQKYASRPFAYPTKRQVWRVGAPEDDEVNHKSYTELVFNPEDIKLLTTDDVTGTYIVQYIKKPYPIILTDFSTEYGDGVTIEGYNGSETMYKDRCCFLGEGVHEEIIQKAVELAKAAMTGDLATQIQLGRASQTEIAAPTAPQPNQ